MDTRMQAMRRAVLSTVAFLCAASTRAQDPGAADVDGLLLQAEQHLVAGRYGRARTAGAQALSASDKGGEGSILEAARALHVLAAASLRLGRYDDAEAECRKSLILRERKLGETHPDVAASLELRAAILSEQDKHTCREAAERALEIREAATTPSDPSVVPSLLFLAACERHRRRGDGAKKAGELIERALAIAETSGHRLLSAECHHALAALRLGERRLEEAEKAETQALAIWREALGAGHPDYGRGLARLAGVREAQGRTREAREACRESIRVRLSGLSDEELCRTHELRDRRFEDILSPRPWSETEKLHGEMFLAEMGRRGGKVIADFLQLEAGSQLELLTVLRRAQGKRDPVEVAVRGPEERESVFPELPTFDVALVNVDEDEASVNFTEGGNYRSGRMERWRFDVVDSAGNTVPPSWIQDGMRGGLYTESQLAPGESWETSLAMADYIEIPSPGEYTVRIQYHDHREISEFALVDDLVVSTSRPIRMCVTLRAIEATRAELDAAAAWLGKLDAREPLKVLAGQYGSGAYDYFIPPGSPQGKLLALGWKAFPALVAEVVKDDIDPARRAWVLSLLFTISGRNDPRADGGDALGSHEFRTQGRMHFGGRPGEGHSGGGGLGGNGTFSGGPPKAAAQLALIEAWRAWKDFIVVKETP
jgi:tetratricopeptide (TPR) repeat protein